MSERRRSAFWGVLFGYGSVGISLTRNILFVPIYLHSIALPEYGAWLATGGALAMLLVNDFGLAGVVTQRASAAAGAGEWGLFGALAGSALVIGAALSLLLAAVSLLLLPLLSPVDSLTAVQRHVVLNCYGISIAANAFGIVGSTAASIIRSLQKSILAGSITLAADLANILVTLIGILGGAGLYAIAGGILVRAVLVTAAAVAALLFLLRRRLQVPLTPDWRAVRGLFADSSRFFVTSIAMKLQSQANVYFVGSILGPGTAAVYGLTVRAHETVLMLTGQINSALVPSITHLVGSGNLARFREVVLRVLLTMAALTAFAMTVTVTANAGFLQLWVGREVFGGQALSVLTGAALFAASLGYVAYDALIAEGRFRLVSAVFAVSSLVHVTLLVALLHHGVWVAPAVTLTSALIWGGAFWRSIGRTFALTGAELRGLGAQLALLVAVSGLVAVLFINLYPPASTWRELLLEAASCMVALALGYWFCSGAMRSLAREEIAMTRRLFSSR